MQVWILRAHSLTFSNNTPALVSVSLKASMGAAHAQPYYTFLSLSLQHCHWLYSVMVMVMLPYYHYHPLTINDQWLVLWGSDHPPEYFIFYTPTNLLNQLPFNHQWSMTGSLGIWSPTRVCIFYIPTILLNQLFFHGCLLPSLSQFTIHHCSKLHQQLHLKQPNLRYTITIYNLTQNNTLQSTINGGFIVHWQRPLHPFQPCITSYLDFLRALIISRYIKRKILLHTKVAYCANCYLVYLFWTIPL